MTDQLAAEIRPEETMEYRVLRQEFSNVPGMYTGANFVCTVEDTSRYDDPKAYLDGHYMFEIHDCTRRVHVHVNLITPWERHNALKKVRLLAEMAVQYKDAIEAEIASIEAKEAKRKAAGAAVVEGVIDLTGQKPVVVPGEETIMPQGGGCALSGKVDRSESVARELPVVSMSPEPTPENCKLWC